MPIKPENRARYPANWTAIRQRILERATHRCEQCGVKNHAFGYRNAHGRFVDCGDAYEAESMAAFHGARALQIVLTIAHLDHTPEHCEDDNLRALCQRCHLHYDAHHHAHNAFFTRRARKRNLELFEL